MSYRQFSIAFIVFVLLGPLLTPAQWKALGPFGGDVRSLAQDPHQPQKLFLGTVDSQIFVSNDRGAHWERLSALAPRSDFVVDHILIDPRNSLHLYAGVWSVSSNNEGGVFSSADGGKTWKSLPGIDGQSVRALALAPSDPRILVAGTLEGIFESTDEGMHWKQISPPGHAEIRNVESIAVDPRDPQIIYAGTWHLPWKTVDGGKTWASIPRGIIQDSDVFAIFIQPKTPTNVLLSACTGIYNSEDSGNLWAKLQGIPSSSRRTRAIVANLAEPQIIYAGTTEGLWKSGDRGHTWRLLTSRTLTVNSIVLDEQNPSRVFLGTDDSGVLVSTDAGEHFVAQNEGFTSRAISSVLFDQASPGRIYVAVLNDSENGGVFRSDNGGLTWRQQIRGLTSTDVHTLFESPEDHSLWAGTTDGAFVLEASADRWRRADLMVELASARSPGTRRPAPGRRGRAAASTEADSTFVKGMGSVMAFSGDPGFGHYFFAASQRGLFLSRDSGLKWKQLPTLDPNAGGTAVLALPDGRVFFGTSAGLFISKDAGLHFSPVALDDGPMPIHRIVAVPGKNQIILMATGEGLYRSEDGGTTWGRAQGGLPRSDIADIHCDTHRGLRIYVTESYFGSAYRSTDLGATWEWINPFRESGMKYKSVLADPNDPSRYYALFFREGLYSFGASDWATTNPPGAVEAQGSAMTHEQNK